MSRLVCSPLIAVLILAAPALAQDINSVHFDRVVSRIDGGAADSFSFEVDIFAGGITDGVVTSPTGFMMTLAETEPGLWAADPDFTTLADFNAAVPDGNYDISLNGGSISFTLGYAPTAPDGFVSITSPTNGETGVALDPTFLFANGCGNCEDEIILSLFDDAETFEEVAMLSGSATSHSFGTTLAEDALHFLGALVFNRATSSEMVDMDSFSYIQVASDENEVEFTTVPEPTSAALLALGLAGLAGAGRRRQR